MIKLLEKVFYIVKIYMIGGCDGVGVFSDGVFDVWLSLLGLGKLGMNLEQLFGVGYLVCFMGVMQIVVVVQKIILLQGMVVDVSVLFGCMENDIVYGFVVMLVVFLFGFDCIQVWLIVDGVYQVCLYLYVICGNIDVVIDLV